MEEEGYKKLRDSLKNPPTHEEMFLDIKMNNLSIKQRSGDIDVLRIADRNVLEKLWKSNKITIFISNQRLKLEKMGLDHGKIEEHVNTMYEELEQEMVQIKTPMDGFLSEGVLELEVFKKHKRVKN